MKKQHKAFTLAEVMVSLIVIGVIMCFYIPVKKTIDDLFTTLGYFAYDNVNLIVRQLISGDKDKYIETVELEGVKRTILVTDDETFCDNILDITNTVGSDSCSSLYTATGTSISSLDPENPTFVTTNGSRYYLSSRISPEASIAAGISSTYGYRVLSVDLNGKKKPNFVAGTGKGSKFGDIITFLIFDNGDVVPTGQASTDRNYINTRVKALKFDGGTDSTKPYTIQYLQATNGTTTMPYKEAFCNINGDTSHIKVYNCDAANTICPLSEADGHADTCELELVKPVYKYKM